jgi:hypothetical protein
MFGADPAGPVGNSEMIFLKHAKSVGNNLI